jgi:hypothetical protein
VVPSYCIILQLLMRFITQTPLPAADMTRLLAAYKKASSEPDPDGVELLSVGLAQDIRQIMVVFKGSPGVIANWWQGSVFVVDESRAMVYKIIPVAPLIGPLIGKPKEADQVGYCMLVNQDGGITSGSVVTVVLGSYKREHIKVQ